MDAKSITNSSNSIGSVSHHSSVGEPTILVEYGLYDTPDHKSGSPVPLIESDTQLRHYSKKHAFRQFFRNTIDDVKKVPWAYLGRRFLSHVLPLIVVIVSSVLLSHLPSPAFGDGSQSPCQPDGTFLISDGSYNPWRPDSIFTINLAFGSFSFGVAKFIDISWDVVVGRGGQALLAIATYQVFTKALIRSMESSPVSHNTFKALTLQPDSISGALTLTKEFFTNRGTRARFAMFWTILCLAFILAFPTWVSAMTGYTAALQPFIQVDNGSLVSTDDFLPVMYVIHDGERVGLTNNYHVTIKWGEWGIENVTLSDPDSYEADGWLGCTTEPNATSQEWQPDMTIESCAWLWRVSEYTSQYGFLGTNDTDTTFHHPNGTDLFFKAEDGPLNISGSFNTTSTIEQSCEENFVYPWNELPFGFNEYDNTTGSCYQHEPSPLYYHSASNTTYDLNDLNSRGSCLQLDQVKYAWGFSFLLLYVFVVVFMCWTIVMFAIYLDAYFNSCLDANHRRLGVERAVLDLSLVMQKKIHGKDATFFCNKKIQRHVRSGCITYSNLPLDSLQPSRRTQLHRFWTITRVQLSRRWRMFEFRSWVKQEMWWLIALFVFTLLFLLSLASPTIEEGWSKNFSSLPCIGVVFVLVIGRGVRSRWVSFALCFLVFWIGNITYIVTQDIDY